jgi:hypothetical protein
VSCEGRIDVLRREHIFGAGQPRHVRRSFAGKQRIVCQSPFLRALDLAIPVSPFHQPRRDPPTSLRAQCVGPSNDGSGAFRISLHRHTVPIPAFEPAQARNTADDVEAHLQPLAFLGINREGYAPLCRSYAKSLQQFSEHRHAPVPVRHFIARMKRGKLD